MRNYALITIALVTAILSACGGGASSSGTGSVSGNQGGGGTGPPAISQLVPSSIQANVSLAAVMVYGTNLSSKSQALIDGVAAQQTYYLPGGVLQAEIPASFITLGTHQISVQDGENVTSSLPLTVVPAQAGPQVMQAIPGFFVGMESPSYVVSADINNDGRSDVIIGPIGQTPGTVAILYGESSGSLSAPQYVTTPNTPAGLAVGDVDGDGNADLVSLALSQEQLLVSIQLGDGQGNFSSGITLQPLPADVIGTAFLADLDGDGKVDLIVSYKSAADPSTYYTLIWFRNLGGGNFAPAVTLATLGSEYFSVADFNRDGRPDILYTTYVGGPSQHILMNSGAGKFVDEAAAGLNGLTGTATVVDFNLDGIPDLVLQVYQLGNTVGSLYSFAGNGDGSFTQVSVLTSSLFLASNYNFVAGDFDHDGFPDLAAGIGEEPSEILFLFGDGRGNFIPQYVVGPQGFYAAVGDFNGDGLDDVVLADQFNFVSLALGRADRNFPSAVSLSPATAIGISAGDIDGDGWPDLLIGGDSISGTPGTVYLNQRNNSFQLAAYTDPGSFQLADLTGDGLADLLTGKGSNLVIWPNNRTPSFSSSTITVPQPMSAVWVADMDGDGHPDMLSDAPPGQIFYGNSQYQFTPLPLVSSGQSALGWPYAIGDFNGDGKLDIAIGDYTYLNAGSRTFRPIQPNGLPSLYSAVVVVADFNGDGKEDIAAIFPGYTFIWVFYGNGDGTFHLAIELDAGQYIGSLGVADFNGDGKPDLVAGLEMSHQACIFFNLGQGQFAPSYFASGADTDSLIAIDLNRDGKPDVAVTNFIYSFEPANADVIFHK